MENETEQKTVDQPQRKEEFVAKPPDYNSFDGSVWINKDKNGNDYLTVHTPGHKPFVFFKNIPKVADK